jgi:hypothetical protein
MVANVTRAWLVFAGLVAVVYGCSGESSSNEGAGDAGATASAGSSGASEADAGEAGSSGASGAAGSGAASTGGAAGSSTGGMGGDVSGSGGAGGASAGGGAGNAGGSAGNAGGSAGSEAGTGGSGGIPADECDSNEDCPPNECLVPPCPELVCALGSQGYRVCQTRDPLPVGNCSEPTGEPCCESSEDCQDAAGGHCVPFSLGYCGGPAPPDTSTCRYDTCDSDSDCSAGENGVCLLDYPRTCNYGPCNDSADCTEGAGGRCVMTRAGQPCPELVVYCQYDDDACDSDDDCPTANGMRQVCEPDADGHGRRCAPWQPPPP